LPRKIPRGLGEGPSRERWNPVFENWIKKNIQNPNTNKETNFLGENLMVSLFTELWLQ
jgi:hypothetical protein